MIPRLICILHIYCKMIFDMVVYIFFSIFAQQMKILDGGAHIGFWNVAPHEKNVSYMFECGFGSLEKIIRIIFNFSVLTIVFWHLSPACIQPPHVGGGSWVHPTGFKFFINDTAALLVLRIVRKHFYLELFIN